jgi:DNA-binding HxlR family transcriptional regulator
MASKSSWLILREAYYGTTYFQDFALEAEISEPAAAARLKELVEAGLLSKVPYQEPGQRTRQRYTLTDAGLQLITPLLALMEWGDRHLAPDGGPVRFRHKDCHAAVHVGLHCNQGHTLTAEEIEIVPGPAVGSEAASTGSARTKAGTALKTKG